MKVRIKVSENNKERRDYSRFILLYCSLLVYSGTTICAKYASSSKFLSVKFFLFIGIEVGLLGIYAIMWQQVLKKMTLVSAMASKGIVVIFGLIWSVLLFSEKISMYNVVGAVIIILGIWMVSLDG